MKLHEHEGPEANERSIEEAVQDACSRLIELQEPDGSWCFELEADCTIPAEYIAWMHFTGDVDEVLQTKLAAYLRQRQNDQGGWPLYHGGVSEISCSVKAYYALKLAGDSPDEPHMAKSRDQILELGGAAKCNVFSRIFLALFQQLPWRGVPCIPVEIVLLPRWFPFHLGKVSYWSRTVVVPLSVLCTLKPRAKNPKNIAVSELFVRPPELEKDWFPVRSKSNKVFIYLDAIVRKVEPFIPSRIRSRALKKAEEWMLERLNGEHGLGAIFPAMVNAHEALLELGYGPEDRPVVQAKRAVQNLIVQTESSAYCQPCFSPVWDTALAAAAMIETDTPESRAATAKGLRWLAGEQLSDEPGDWRDNRPSLEGGGWAFQYKNPHYPDIDDAAIAAYVMETGGEQSFSSNIRRAANWIVGMQSRNGGHGAFDADNTAYWLNEIPFADHGALLDPPTSDVSARCAMLLATLVDQYPEYRPVLERSLDYLTREQEPDGAWFGRWGTNYVYGTWSVLVALEKAGVPNTDPRVQRAAQWCRRAQHDDGGWGESNETYFKPELRGKGIESTPFQTAWALLALMAAGEVRSEAVRRGVEFLMRTQGSGGLWDGPQYTAPGFPRVFYLKYHGYYAYFPLWALARYRNLADRTDR